MKNTYQNNSKVLSLMIWDSSKSPAKKQNIAFCLKKGNEINTGDEIFAGQNDVVFTIEKITETRQASMEGYNYLRAEVNRTKIS